MKNDIYDPLGLEIFVIEESFESVFSSLRGVYYRLYAKEGSRPDSERSIEREERFLKRFQEITPIKKRFAAKDWEAKRQAVATYAPELREMLQLEQVEYDS